MQPVRKASENIYSSQSGLKQRKTRIPRCSSPTTLSQNSQLHSLHGGHGCLTNMTSQIHEITNMQFTQVLQLRNHKLTKTQKCRSRSQCNTENHSSSTPISSFADSRIECRSWLSHKHDIPNSQICRFSNTFSQIHGSSNITSQDHVSSNTISQVRKFTYFTKVMVVSQAWRCKFLVHNSSRSGQKPPKIFAPPFEMNESGSIPDSIKPSSINLYIHLYTILQQSLQKDKVWKCNRSRIRRYSPNIDSFRDRRIISFQSSQKYIWRIPSQSMKIHRPVQHPKYADRLTPWLRTEARGLKSIHYTPTQAGKQSRTDCFTQTCGYDSWLRIAVPPIAVVDNPHTAESTSNLDTRLSKRAQIRTQPQLQPSGLAQSRVSGMHA